MTIKIMGIEKSLKDLRVTIRGGGNLISHPPIFSTDSKYLFLISHNSVLVYSTESGLKIETLNSPQGSPIANLGIVSSGTEEFLCILTEIGELVVLSVPDFELESSDDLNHGFPKGWTKIRKWTNFLTVPNTLNEFFAVGHPENEEELMLYKVTKVQEKRGFNFDKICWRMLPNNCHIVALGADNRLITAIQKDSVFMKSLDNGLSRWHKSGTRNFTAVAVHPTDMIVATGDDSGRILLWRNFFEKSPAKTVLHWHTLPVADLCFSSDGSTISSGGGECTLVKWDISNPENKRTIPRLGLPIRHVRVSRANIWTAVSHAENCIRLLDASNTVIRTIQNITQSYIPENNEENTSEVFPAGLHIDPNTKALVLNGRPGHLQCYSFMEDKHLYTMDITQQNYITGERTKAIPNSNVSHIAFSSHGQWLATVESLEQNLNDNEEKVPLELRLKFWKFSKEKQKFLLNTSINWPHEVSVVNLRFQPIDNDTSSNLILATSGGDRKFKIWGLVLDESIRRVKNEWWDCEFAGAYRDAEAGPLTFSQDGSVLAVPFHQTLTIWNLSNQSITGALCHAKLQDAIKLVEFGTHPNSHLVICSCINHLAVWDVITLSLVWAVPFAAESIAVDPRSNLVAAFSAKKNLYFFKPDTPEPLAIHNNVSRSRVLSSLFVPAIMGNTSTGLKSTLMFINATQELCQLEPSEATITEPLSRLRIGAKDQETHFSTPFAKLIAEKTVTQPKKSVGLDQTPYNKGVHIIREIMSSSPSTMPSVSYFCNQFLSTISSTQPDSFPELEQHILKSYQERKLPENIEIKDNLQEPINSNTLESKPLTLEVDIDLDLAATEDTSWIKAIFNPSN